MNEKDLLLISQFLENASDEFATHECNDFDFPESWTEKDKRAFIRAYHNWNGNPEEYDADNLSIPDYAAMSFLAHVTEKMSLSLKYGIIREPYYKFEYLREE